MPASFDIYVDLLNRVAVRSLNSAAPASVPDLRKPQAYTVNLYFLRRQSVSTENYDYTRFSTAKPIVRLRRNRPPEYATFTLDFNGFTSDVIDARLSAEAITKIIEAVPSIGKGNVKVVGDYVNGFTIEFINSHAGVTQPLFSGRMITPSTGQIIIKQTQAGGSGLNSIQTVRVREAALAVATGWVEIGVPATPGWSATIDTTGIPSDIFDQPDLIMEVYLDATNFRTGADGITALESTTRNAADGVIADIPAVVGVTGLPFINSDGVAHLVALSGTTVYGRLWSKVDIGKKVSDASVWLDVNTVITDVIDTAGYNAVVLSKPFLQTVISGPITFQIDATPSRYYTSASASFLVTDVGHAFTGTNIPAGTVVESVIAGDTIILSQTPTASGSGLSWTLTAIPSDIFQSASAAFTAADVGARIEAPQVPVGTYIRSYLSATQVRMTQRALAAAGGQSWTLRPKSTFSSPAVTSTASGSLTANETQKISLTQQLVDGVLKIRDGADPLLPLVRVPAPVTAFGIQQSLNDAYPNFGGITVAETVPGGDFLVTWGTKGKQFLLAVDESEAVYDPLVAILQTGQQRAIGIGEAEQSPEMDRFVPEVPTLNKLGKFGLWLCGVTDNNYLAITKWPQVFQLSDGTGAYEIRIRFMGLMDSNVAQMKPTIGQQFNFGGKVFYFDHIENLDEKAGMRSFDWVGYTVPSGRTEILQQNRPVYTVPKTWLNGVLVDMQIASVSVSTWVSAIYSYRRIVTQADMINWAKPADGPFGSIIHFVSVGGFTGAEIAWAGNGFQVGDNQHAGAGTFGLQFDQNWVRRKWRSNIWEQVVFHN